MVSACADAAVMCMGAANGTATPFGPCTASISNASVAAAVSLSRAGDVVALFPGRFDLPSTEAAGIIVRHNLTVSGIGDSKDVVLACPGDVECRGFVAEGADLALMNLTIVGGRLTLEAHSVWAHIVVKSTVRRCAGDGAAM